MNKMDKVKKLYHNQNLQKVFWGIIAGVAVATGMTQLSQEQQDGLLQLILGVFS